MVSGRAQIVDFTFNWVRLSDSLQQKKEGMLLNGSDFLSNSKY